MASLGAVQEMRALPPCSKRGSCLCVDARIATLRACRRAAAGERGRSLSWSSQTGGSCLRKSPHALAQGVSVQHGSCLVLSPQRWHPQHCTGDVSLLLRYS